MKKGLLKDLYPELEKEWDFEKNTVPFDTITCGSGYRAFWKCIKGHKWDTDICSRVSKRTGGPTQCPKCKRKRVKPEDRLDFRFPEIAKQWSLKNDISVEVVSHASNKKYWWICEKGHEWEAKPNDRANKGNGCPSCSGRVATPETSLACRFPELLKEWDYGRNKLDPNHVTYGSGSKVWWKCSKGHNWEQTVWQSVANKNRCPFCTKRKDNTLDMMFPYLLDGWDYDKNYPITPKDVSSRSCKSVWWKCNKGHGWKTRVIHRVNGTGCPMCNRQSSRLQLYLYCEVKYFYPDSIYRHKVKGMECDIYIPTHNIGIELDSYRWHKDKNEKDLQKVKQLASYGVRVISIRENGLDGFGGDTIWYKKHIEPLNLSKLLISKLYDVITDNRLADYGNSIIPVNHTQYLDELSRYPMNFGESLLNHNPKLCKSWDYEKNGKLIPDKVSAFSHLKVWWVCLNGHSWQAAINNRNQLGNGCPICYRASDKSQYRNPVKERVRLNPLTTT